jgi:NAD(P)-dependent dehydrogenase (short-subunit alcohol dehydrogenase family)
MWLRKRRICYIQSIMVSTPSKQILVSGATGALGTEVLKKYVSCGFDVTALYHKANPVELASHDSPKVHWTKVDLSSSASVKEALHGKVFDVLVHCAGGFRFAPIDQTTDEDLEFLINVNLRSAILLLREILPEMKKRNFGRIVFVSSKATLHPSYGMGAYVATKAGLNQLTEVLKEETKGYDITINSVLPSIIDTVTNRKDMPNAKFSDWVSTHELAEIIFGLTSPLGNSINGALIPVSGKL